MFLQAGATSDVFLMDNRTVKLVKQHDNRPQRNWEAHLFVDWHVKLTRSMVEDVLPATISISKVWQRHAIKDKKVRFKVLESFYGVPVRNACMSTGYIVYLLIDTAPEYSVRKTKKGKHRVNVGI